MKLLYFIFEWIIITGSLFLGAIIFFPNTLKAHISSWWIIPILGFILTISFSKIDKHAP